MTQIRNLGCQPIGKEPDLLAHPARLRIAGKQLKQLVFEDAGATRLEKEEGQSCVDVRRHPLQNVCQVSPRRTEKAEIVERSAAADVPSGVRTRNPASVSKVSAAVSVSGW